MATVTPRLDLDMKVVERAKRAFANRKYREPESIPTTKIPFSETAELAIREFSERILKCLDEAGFRTQANVERGRPRRVPEELWKALGKMSEDYDASRVTILRAALALLAAEVPEEGGETPKVESGAADEGEADAPTSRSAEG